MKALWYLALTIMLPLYSPAASLYSASEGVLAKGHDLTLNTYRRRYFYNSDGSLNPQKMNKLLSFLEFQKGLLWDSEKMNRKTNLIWVHGYNNEEAEKKGLKAQSSDPETIAPLIFAMEQTRELLSSYKKMTPNEIHEKVETILLFFAAGYTPYPMTRFTKFNQLARNVLENFLEWRIDDRDQLQASNLLLNGRFASQEDLAKARKQGLDLSKLNPPSSPIWTDNEVESYDPYNEVYFGERLFPPREDPLPEFYYERMGNGQIKMKTYWLDPREADKKGGAKKKDVTLRLGREAYTTPVANHFARIIGYPAIPSTYRPRVKLNLGEVTFEEFTNQWRRIHGLVQGSVATYVERVPGENALILKGVVLEAYPEKENYRRMGPFRMGDNGLRNRREYRALPLYAGLISLGDLIGHQSRVDAYKDPAKGWRPLFFISDTGSSFGFPSMPEHRGIVNEFTWYFTRRTQGQIRLFWCSGFDPRSWEDTTYSDVKWLARRIARIKTKQIEDILATSGFPPPVQALYAEKLKSRINTLIHHFELEKEGFSLHPVLSKEALAHRYPEYINDKGKLKEGAQEDPENTHPLLGEGLGFSEKALSMALWGFQNKLFTLFNPESYKNRSFVIDLGSYDTKPGIGFAASREVTVNPELGPGQHRYLLRDRLSMSIPVGLFTDYIVTPAARYYTYTFQYVHSVATAKQIRTSRFFGMYNPFRLQDIRRNLLVGEQLIVTHAVGASVGKVKLKLTDNIRFEAALFSRGITTVKSFYFSKPTGDLFEAATDHIRVGSRETGFDLRFYLRLAAKLRGERSKRAYKIYRLDTLNETPEGALEAQKAFEKALIENNFSALDQLVEPHRLKVKTRSKASGFGFLLWNYSSDTGLDLIEADGREVVVAHKTRAYDRALNRLWKEKIHFGSSDGGLKYMANFWNEGQITDISFEGLPDKDKNTFAESEVNITLSMLDNYCTRKEFEGEFKPFFQERSGQKSDYIRYDMPRELESYPELGGTMRWQLSSRALRDILEAASEPGNLSYLSSSGDDEDHVSGSAEKVSSMAARLLNAFNGKSRPSYTPEEQAQDLIYVFDRLIGKRGRHMGRLRGFVKDEDIWMITGIINMLDLTNPTFAQQADKALFWAPEVGKYQGHSFLERFRRSTLLNPIFIE